MRQTSFLAIVFAVLSAAASAAAQSAVPPAALAAKAKPGDRLTVSTSNGAELKGRLVSLGPDALVLESSRVRKSVPYADIDSVKRRKNGVLLGAIIGAAAGFATGLPAKSLVDNETGDGASALLFCLGVGIGAGIGIDAALSVDRTIYRSPSRLAHQGIIVEPRKRGIAVGWTAAW